MCIDCALPIVSSTFCQSVPALVPRELLSSDRFFSSAHFSWTASLPRKLKKKKKPKNDPPLNPHFFSFTERGQKGFCFSKIFSLELGIWLSGGEKGERMRGRKGGWEGGREGGREN